jgi:hypothetical protein
VSEPTTRMASYDGRPGCEAVQGGHWPGGGHSCERPAGHSGDHCKRRGAAGQSVPIEFSWRDPDTAEQVDAKLLDYFRGGIADYHIERLRKGLGEARPDGDWHGELVFLLSELERTAGGES